MRRGQTRWQKLLSVRTVRPQNRGIIQKKVRFALLMPSHHLRVTPCGLPFNSHEKTRLFLGTWGLRGRFRRERRENAPCRLRRSGPSPSERGTPRKKGGCRPPEEAPRPAKGIPETQRSVKPQGCGHADLGPRTAVVKPWQRPNAQSRTTNLALANNPKKKVPRHAARSPAVLNLAAMRRTQRLFKHRWVCLFEAPVVSLACLPLL